MTRKQLESMNADLIALLTSLGEQIDDALEELGVATGDDDDECIDNDSSD